MHDHTVSCHPPTPSCLAHPQAGGGNFHELTSLTAGWVERDWANASLRQWVEPGSVTVQPGDAARFGYRVMLADSVRDKDAVPAATSTSFRDHFSRISQLNTLYHPTRAI